MRAESKANQVITVLMGPIGVRCAVSTGTKGRELAHVHIEAFVVHRIDKHAKKQDRRTTKESIAIECECWASDSSARALEDCVEISRAKDNGGNLLSHEKNHLRERMSDRTQVKLEETGTYFMGVALSSGSMGA